MMKPVGRLESVELRELWESEATGFTPWLAQEENLNLLADTIGMDLELESIEKFVGPFRADILCKNTQDDSWVLVENQLEKTDHTHLGQLITYASGLQTVSIVWIAKKFTEEHRSALDWLNQITDEQFRFFGLEIELWKIGNSSYAPRFNVIVKPNTWSKSVLQASNRIKLEATTPTKEKQWRYWEKLIELLKERDSSIGKNITPKPQHWLNFSIGRTGVLIRTTVNLRDKCIAVELNLYDGKISKIFFQQLEQDKQIIEQEMQEKLDWQELKDKIGCRIVLYNHMNPTDEENWEKQHLWMKEMLERFDSVFRKRLKYLSENLIEDNGAEIDDEIL